MLRVDVPIWYNFLEEHKEKFIALYYDCLLGGPGFTPANYTEKLRGMWKYLGSKRADVIAETKEAIWIIEVTNDVKVKAMGQLMMYKSLWLDDPKSTKPGGRTAQQPHRPGTRDSPTAGASRQATEGSGPRRREPHVNKRRERSDRNALLRPSNLRFKAVLRSDL
jgi:hypothetical protein